MRCRLTVLAGSIGSFLSIVSCMGAVTTDDARSGQEAGGPTVPTGVGDPGRFPDGDVDATGDEAPSPGDGLALPAGDPAEPPPGDAIPPSSCAFPQGVPEEGFIGMAASYSDTDPAVDAAVNAVMKSLTGCNIGSSCDIVGFPGSNADEVCQSWFAAVTAELRQQGYCAGQHEVGATDEIAVSNTGCAGKWYGYHICYYGGPTVVWNPGARRGWYQILSSYCE